MTSRQRVLCALNHQEPDRLPIDMGTTDSTIAYEVCQGLAEMLGMDSEKFGDDIHPGACITPNEEMLGNLGIGTRLLNVPAKECR